MRPTDTASHCFTLCYSYIIYLRVWVNYSALLLIFSTMPWCRQAKKGYDVWCVCAVNILLYPPCILVKSFIARIIIIQHRRGI